MNYLIKMALIAAIRIKNLIFDFFQIIFSLDNDYWNSVSTVHSSIYWGISWENQTYNFFTLIPVINLDFLISIFYLVNTVKPM